MRLKKKKSVLIAHRVPVNFKFSPSVPSLHRENHAIVVTNHIAVRRSTSTFVYVKIAVRKIVMTAEDYLSLRESVL